MKRPLYLDYQATTPLDPNVLQAMLPYFGERFGNAASHGHTYGAEAREAVERSRRRVAGLLGAAPEEIVFTSGSTEAINLALKGACLGRTPQGGHLITTRTEHRAVLDVCEGLESQGLEVTYLSPDAEGRIAPEDVRAALRPETFLVALIWGNNEVGTVNPVRDIGRLCRERGVLLFTDATQAAGKIPISARRDHVDLLCLSGHKLYGPKGVGALWVRGAAPPIRLVPQIDGGRHEGGLRSGTLNVPGIVGLGVACELAADNLNAEGRRLASLRDELLERVRSALGGVHLNGHPRERIPGNLNLSFEGVTEAGLGFRFEKIAISTGCACSSASANPSHVLRSMGLSAPLARSAIRIGLGRPTTPEDIRYAAREVVRVVERRRALSRPAFTSSPSQKSSQ